MVFFFKQKTAYEMRISDWSSDVCSSDLRDPHGPGRGLSGSGYWSASGRVCPHPCFSVLYIRLLPFGLQNLSHARHALVGLSGRTEPCLPAARQSLAGGRSLPEDRKSTRLNSSH